MTPLTAKRIGVLMGGTSTEREISLKSGTAVAEALRRREYTVRTVDADRNVAQTLREEEIEMAFLALHGAGGEDGTIQGLLEVLRIPYTGSGVMASAVGMSKPGTKKFLNYHRIQTPRWTLRRRERDHEASELPQGFGFPVVVKPVDQGSTIGVSIVREEKDLVPAQGLAYGYGPEIILEEYIDGKEITVGILGEEPLPVIEIVPQKDFFTFDAKYQKGATEYRLPAPLSEAVYQEVQSMAVHAHRALGCEGFSRVDFRVNPKGVPYVLEVNTIPGMTETSLLPKAAAHANIPYDVLVERILASAVEREKSWG